MKDRQSAFSLVEVVLALGVISFAIVAILGVIPIGLQTSHSAQDETRAAQIAQTVLNTMAGEAQTKFTAVLLPLPSAPTIDLSSSNTSASSPAAFFYAENDGQISEVSTNATYSISVITDNFSSPSATPPPFDSGYANKVTVRIVSPPLSAAGATPNANQSVRDYIRVISKY
jgi:uncharacterized protein (TIGR02598 family)